MAKRNKSNRGFAKLKQENPERLQEIASEGGRAAHESGNAHEFNSEEAKKAGQKGGRSRGQNR
jgi:general stress protein YciG